MRWFHDGLKSLDGLIDPFFCHFSPSSPLGRGRIDFDSLVHCGVTSLQRPSYSGNSHILFIVSYQAFVASTHSALESFPHCVTSLQNQIRWDENEPLVGLTDGEDAAAAFGSGMAGDEGKKGVYGLRLQIRSGNCPIIKDTSGHRQANDLWKMFHGAEFTVTPTKPSWENQNSSWFSIDIP